jgi:ferritin-like metal-binding protein YciE
MQAMRELLIDQMKDMYDAEKQLVKALPKMAKAAANDELSQAFEEHLEQTRGHVERIERAFEMLGEKAKSRTCGESGLRRAARRFGDHLLGSESRALRNRRLRDAERMVEAHGLERRGGVVRRDSGRGKSG